MLIYLTSFSLTGGSTSTTPPRPPRRACATAGSRQTRRAPAGGVQQALLLYFTSDPQSACSYFTLNAHQELVLTRSVRRSLRRRRLPASAAPCSATAAHRSSEARASRPRRAAEHYPLVAPLALSFERALNLALACALGSGGTCTPTPPPSATATPCASGAVATGAVAHRDFLPGRIISSDLETCTDICSVLGARSPSTVDMKSPSGRYAWVQRVAAWVQRVAA